MIELKTADPVALSLLMNDDLYLVNDKIVVDHVLPEETKDIASVPDNSAAPAYNYLGENNKYILILVDQIGDEIIKPGNLKDLTNILTAKELDLRDVAILNRRQYPDSSLDSLKQFFAFGKLILFGINPTELGLPGVASNTLTAIEGIKILASYSFDEMQNDRNKKLMFWNAMKEL